jgi:hypothetical protein
MLTAQTIDYIAYGAIGISAFMISWFVFTEVRNRLDQCKQHKQYEEAQRVATQNYIQGLLEKIGQLEDEVRSRAFRELGYLNERKVTNERLRFMSQELSYDPDKKTQVLSR